MLLLWASFGQRPSDPCSQVAPLDLAPTNPVSVDTAHKERSDSTAVTTMVTTQNELCALRPPTDQIRSLAALGATTAVNHLVVDTDLYMTNTAGWMRSRVALLVVQPTNSDPQYLTREPGGLESNVLLWQRNAPLLPILCVRPVSDLLNGGSEMLPPLRPIQL